MVRPANPLPGGGVFSSLISNARASAPDDELHFDDEEIEESRLEWRSCLIGKFLGGRIPPLHAVRRDAIARWKSPSEISVIEMEGGFFSFRFVDDMEDDHLRVLAGGVWTLGGQPISLTLWKPDFNPLKEKIDTAPVWLRFVALPHEYWRQNILAKIAACFGVPLMIDECTRRMEEGRFARVCVELDLSRPLKSGVLLSSGKTSKFFQTVAYEDLPSFCCKCGVMGHLVRECPMKEMDFASPPQQALEYRLASPEESDSARRVNVSQAEEEKGPNKITNTMESSEESSDESDPEPERRKLNALDTTASAASETSAKVAKEDASSEDEDESSDGESEATKPQQKDVVPLFLSKKGSSSGEDEDKSSDNESEEEKSTKTLPKMATGLKQKEAHGHSSGKQSFTTSDIQSKTPAGNQTPAFESRTLFVGNLSFEVTEDDIRHFFKEVGEIVRFTTGEDKRFKGYGHVEFSTAEAAQKALEEFNGVELLGRSIKLNFARERGSYTPKSSKENSYQKGWQAQSEKIFVKGFDASLDSAEVKTALEEHFASCGELSDLSLPNDLESGALKGDRKAFNAALELNRSELLGFPLTVSEAKTKVGDGGSKGGGGGSGSRGGGRVGRGRGSGDRWIPIRPGTRR